jgi:hypothetical protein
MNDLFIKAEKYLKKNFFGCALSQAAAPVGQVLLRRDSHCAGCFGGHPAIFCCCEVLIVGPFFQESPAYLEASK